MKIITLEELKSLLMNKYGVGYDLERTIVVTEIKNNYGRPNHILFSVNGSPPKGQAILHKNCINKWKGRLYYLDTRYDKMSLRKMYDVVEIIKPQEYKEDKKDA